MLGAFAVYVSALIEVSVVAVIVAACVVVVCAVFVPLALDRTAGDGAHFEGEVMGCRLGPGPLLSVASAPGSSARSTGCDASPENASSAGKRPTGSRRTSSGASEGVSNASSGKTIGSVVDVIS